MDKSRDFRGANMVNGQTGTRPIVVAACLFLHISLSISVEPGAGHVLKCNQKHTGAEEEKGGKGKAAGWNPIDMASTCQKKRMTKQKKKRVSTRCPVCGSQAQLVHISEMEFRELLPSGHGVDAQAPEYKLYWRCAKYPVCNTYITADPRTKQPSGLMAGPTLRHKRMCIHHWEQMFISEGAMTKVAFRQMCASQIGFFKQGMVHTRNMTEAECDSILTYLQKLYENQPHVYNMVEARKNSTMWKEVRGLNTAPNHGIKYNDDGTILHRNNSSCP